MLRRHVQVATAAVDAAADALTDLDTYKALGDRGTEYLLAVGQAQSALATAAREATSQLTPAESVALLNGEEPR